MGQQNSRKAVASTTDASVKNNGTSVDKIFITIPFPALPLTQPTQQQSQSHSKLRRLRQFKNFLKRFVFSCHCNRRKLRKHVKDKENKRKLMTSFFINNTGSTTLIAPSAPTDLQLQWLRSNPSLLSYALSKLTFFTRLSKEKLKENEKMNEKMLKFYRDKNGNVTEMLRNINLADLNNNKELRTKLIHKILSQHSSRGILRKVGSPQEIYRRNLKRFENLVAIATSSSSSSTSLESTNFLNLVNVPIATTTTTTTVNTVQTDENNNPIVDGESNENPLNEEGRKLSSEHSGNLLTSGKLPPRRSITTSKNRVEVDENFFEWVRKNMGKGKLRVNDVLGLPSKTDAQVAITVGKAEIVSSSDAGTNDKNNNPGNKPDKFNFLKKGEGRRSSTAGRLHSETPTKTRKTTDSSTSSTTTTYPTTTTTTYPTSTYPTTTSPNKSSSDGRRCDKCGPCAGKGALAGAPPAYLDYGEAGAANSAGEAWKGKRKGDPVMDRLKNVDVVEEMTYLVPNPDCCGGGDGCDEVDGMEEDDCDYYAVCESCGEMEPVPEELKNELKKSKKKKKGKTDGTPVTYSRRQRFNFKNKGDMCDEDEGPPYSYQGLQCPGCRCSCCVAGLRRDSDCECKCCQMMGPARKCNSFDEIPVGKNPQIRRILCPEEECAKIREFCTKLMPDNSGMYKFDVENKMFERQVPRTPTPIILEVEAPEPLTKQQLLSLGREVQTKNRLGIGLDTNCQPQEQNPVYLPPIYGQCNPPQCPPQPCQPCCVPNYCCDQANQKKEGSRSGSSYYSYSGSANSYTASTALSELSKTTKTKTVKDSTIKATDTEIRDENNNTVTEIAAPTQETKTSSSGSLPSL